MIARQKDPSTNWHQAFLTMLPAITRHARVSFLELDLEAREEAVQETVCNALVAYYRLCELNKTDVAYPSALARYGVAQVRSGRRIAASLNSKEVLSSYARSRRGFYVDRLDQFDEEENGWRELIVEDRRAGPAEIAGVRLDFSEWLRTLTVKQRRVADALASGETTKDVAKNHGLSASRISQLRRELMDLWNTFTADRPVAAPA